MIALSGTHSDVTTTTTENFSRGPWLAGRNSLARRNELESQMPCCAGRGNRRATGPCAPIDRISGSFSVVSSRSTYVGDAAAFRKFQMKGPCTTCHSRSSLLKSFAAVTEQWWDSLHAQPRTTARRQGQPVSEGCPWAQCSMQPSGWWAAHDMRGSMFCRRGHGTHVPIKPSHQVAERDTHGGFALA